MKLKKNTNKFMNFFLCLVSLVIIVSLITATAFASTTDVTNSEVQSQRSFMSTVVDPSEAETGSLTIAKSVLNAPADSTNDDTFSVKVVLSKGSADVALPEISGDKFDGDVDVHKCYSDSDSDSYSQFTEYNVAAESDSIVMTFDLKNGEEVTIENLNCGLKYDVYEMAGDVDYKNGNITVNSHNYYLTSSFSGLSGYIPMEAAGTINPFFNKVTLMNTLYSSGENTGVLIIQKHIVGNTPQVRALGTYSETSPDQSLTFTVTAPEGVTIPGEIKDKISVEGIGSTVDPSKVTVAVAEGRKNFTITVPITIDLFLFSIVIKDLLPGNYTIEESGNNIPPTISSCAVNGNSRKSGTTANVDIKKEKASSVSYLNAESIPLYFQKVDESGTPLSDAKFEFTKVSSADNKDEWTSDESGPHKVIITEAGKYKLTEIKAPSGYKGLKGPIIFEFDYCGQLVSVDSTYEEDKEKVYPGCPAYEPIVISTNMLSTVVDVHEPDIGFPEVYPCDNTICIENTKITSPLPPEPPAPKYPVSFSKQDVNGNELGGATVRISKAGGGEVATWISNGSVYTVEMESGSYVFEETSSPEGYLIAEPIAFSIDAEGNITSKGVTPQAYLGKKNLIVMVDKPDEDFKEIVFSKQDVNGKGVSGAHIILKDSKGGEIDNWISDGKNKILKVKPGTYSFIEKSAPQGYAIAVPITFTIREDGTVTSDDVSVKEKNTLVMVDNFAPQKTYPVEFSKQNIMRSHELSGAGISLVSSDGKLIDSWISNGKVRTFDLLPGKYTFTETIAPKGYMLAKAISFTVSKDGVISSRDAEVTGRNKNRITMIDKYADVPELPNPNKPDAPVEITIMDGDTPTTYIRVPNPDNPEEFIYIPQEDVPLSIVPKTDDNTNIMFFITLAYVSMAAILLIVILHLRSRKRID